MRHENYQHTFHRKKQPPGYRFKTDDYDEFQVIYVCRGEMLFESQGICRIMEPGDITILRQDSAFRLYCRETGYTGVSYNASGNMPEEFRGEAEVLKATENIKTIARLMDQLLESAPSHSSQELSGLALALGWESIRLSEKVNSLSARTRAPYELAETAKALLQSHIYTSAGIKEILSALPLSHRHLCRYFKKQYGISPKQFQIRSKIIEAKRLLTSTSLTITDIAMELGFASSQHFATQFKKQTGSTPSDWRKGQQSNPNLFSYVDYNRSHIG